MAEFSGTLEIDPRLRSAVIPNLVLESDLSTYERMAIAVITWHGEVAFPKQIRIAHMMGCSVRCARATLKSLQHKGWLEIHPRRDKRGYKTSNHYRLRIPSLTAPDAVSPRGTSCRSDRHQVPNPNLNPDQNLNPEKKKEEDVSAEAAPTSSCPVPASEKPRKTPPEAWIKAKALTVEFRSDVEEATGHAPPRDSFGRDLKLILRMMGDYSETELRRMGSDFFRFRERHGLLLSVPTFYRTRELLAHMTRNGGKT